MPKWAGRWEGGRYYLDEAGRPVYFIERKRRVVKLRTHDPQLALGQLATFLDDPDAFMRAQQPAERILPVYITEERLKRYLEHIRECVKDHRAARRAYLLAWAEKGLDLRSVDPEKLRTTLEEFPGGHAGRVEALNAFCNFLVKEMRHLPAWIPLKNHKPSDPEKARAERVAYSLEELRNKYAELTGADRDLFLVRVCTGLHHTEIEQLEGCKLVDGPLPDKGPGIRQLPEGHEIRGVLQVKHKTKPRHRVSVTQAVLDAALRLRAGVPGRIDAWERFDPIIPSNLRHTFETLSEDCGRHVTYSGTGVDRSLVAQVMGHRANSTMINDRYNKTQIPPCVVIPFPG